MLSAPPPLSNWEDKSINILFSPSLTDKTLVPVGISEDKPLDFSHFVGDKISCFIANSKQDFSTEVLQFLFTERKLPFESVTNTFITFISLFREFSSDFD